MWESMNLWEIKGEVEGLLKVIVYALQLHWLDQSLSHRTLLADILVAGVFIVLVYDLSNYFGQNAAYWK